MVHVNVTQAFLVITNFFHECTFYLTSVVTSRATNYIHFIDLDIMRFIYEKALFVFQHLEQCLILALK